MTNIVTQTVIPELLTTAAAARLCHVGERTLWRWSRSGVAPKPVKIDGGVWYRRDDVREWIAGGCPRCGRRGRPPCGRDNASDVRLRE